MADSETVLSELDPPDDVEIIGIVVNERGVERAIATDCGADRGLSVFAVADLSEEQSEPDAGRKSRHAGEDQAEGRRSGLDTVAYISMAFGNPYGDLWNADELIEGVSLLADMDLQAISLADTVGLATPQQIADLLGPVLERFDGVEIGVHLHSRPDDAAAKVLAAYDVGCRRFDSAIGGLGGCPFAQDVLVGNIPTEKLQALRGRSVDLPLKKPIRTARMAVEIGDSSADRKCRRRCSPFAFSALTFSG